MVKTPFAEEEKEGLKIKSITTQGELDEFEQLNIGNIGPLIKFAKN